MRQVSVLTILLCGLLVALTACGSTQSGSSTQSTSFSIPQGEMLHVLDGATATSTAGQRIVSFHPGTDTSTSLPTGLISQDHQHIYTAMPQNGQTKITITNTQGSTVRTFTIPGTYSTADSGYTKSVLSSNGHWLALKQMEASGARSTFVVVNTQTGKLSETIRLQGDFDLDAVSPDVSRIYLLERLHDGSGHYYVRLYRTDTHQLASAIVVDKSEINDPTMVGAPLTRQMAQGGITAYTLYTDTTHNIAFVHALPLASDYLGARCITLPTGKSAAMLRYYTLALSSDGSLLYAANAALGVVVVINVNDDQAFSDKVRATAHFTPDTTQGNTTPQSAFHSAAVLSSDNSILYFAGVHGIMSMDTHSLTIKVPYAAQQSFTSIALSSDNKTLYAASPTNGIVMVNTDSGQTQQVAQSPVHAPWGIEWVSHV